MTGVKGPDPEVMDAIHRGNAVVFFDVAMGEAQDGDRNGLLGRIKLELFVKDVRREQYYSISILIASQITLIYHS